MNDIEPVTRLGVIGGSGLQQLAAMMDIRVNTWL
jgi:purine nucleoside phosphorylase